MAKNNSYVDNLTVKDYKFLELQLSYRLDSVINSRWLCKAKVLTTQSKKNYKKIWKTSWQLKSRGV